MYIRRKVYSISALEGELLEKSFSKGITQYLQKVADDVKDYEEIAGDNVSPAKEAMLKRFYKYVQENPGKSAAIGGGALATIGGGIALAKYLKNKKRKEAAKSEESKEKNFSEYLDEAYDMGYEYAQREFGWLGDKVKGWADKLTNKAAKKDSEGRKEVDSNKGKYGLGAATASAKGHAKVSAANATAAVARGMEKAGNTINAAEDTAKAKAKEVKDKAVAAKDKAVKAGKDFVKSVKDKATAKVDQAKKTKDDLVKRGKAAYESAKNKVEATGKKVRNTALEGVASVAGKASKAAGKLEKKALKARRYSDEKFEDIKSYRGNGRAALVGDSSAMIGRAFGNRHATNLAKNNPEISDEELIKKGSKRAAIVGGLIGGLGAAGNYSKYGEDPVADVLYGSLPVRGALGGYLGAKKAIKDRIVKRDALKMQGQNVDNKD